MLRDWAYHNVGIHAVSVYRLMHSTTAFPVRTLGALLHIVILFTDNVEILLTIRMYVLTMTVSIVLSLLLKLCWKSLAVRRQVMN